MPGKLHATYIAGVRSRSKWTRKKGRCFTPESGVKEHEIYNMHQRTSEVRIYNPVEWVQKQCMTRHVSEKHFCSLSLRKKYIKTLRFKDSLNLSDQEKAAATNMLRKGQGKDVKAAIARRKISHQERENVGASAARRKVSQQNGR